MKRKSRVQTMSTGNEIIAIAESQCGYHEGRGKHNKYGEWFGLDCVAWCMEFVEWVYNKAGIHNGILGLTREQGGTASCGEMLRWYRENEPDCITKTPEPGCIVIFDFLNTSYYTDHTGIFVSKTSTKITTIDGNTKNEAAGNDANGGWVSKRTRSLVYANPTYIVPRELKLVDIDKLIDEFTPEQVYRLAGKMYPADLYKLYTKLTDFMATLPLPETWAAQDAWTQAIKDGITDGSRPMCPASRLEAATMVERKK